MKSLKDFILEMETCNECTSMTFNFTGLDGAEEAIKSLEGKKDVNIKDNNVTIKVSLENTDMNVIKDVIDKYVIELNKSPKLASDESYAVKVKKFADTADKLTQALEELNNPEEPEKKEEE